MSNERQQRAARAEQMRKEREKASRRQRNLISVAIVVVVVGLIALGTWAVKSESDRNATNKELVAPAATTDDYGVVYDAAAAGAELADDAPKPVEVVVYEDFQCPACQAFESANGAFLDKAVGDGQITVEYRPIAFLDRASTTEYSTRSANAALCVLEDSGVTTFKAMHDLLFANQPAEGSAGLANDDLVAMAGQAGAGDIETCVRKRTYGPWLADATDASRDAGVSATPTVLVAGDEVEGAGGGSPSTAELQAAIEKAAA